MEVSNFVANMLYLGLVLLEWWLYFWLAVILLYVMAHAIATMSNVLRKK